MAVLRQFNEKQLKQVYAIVRQSIDLQRKYVKKDKQKQFMNRKAKIMKLLDKEIRSHSRKKEEKKSLEFDENFLLDLENQIINI